MQDSNSFEGIFYKESKKYSKFKIIGALIVFVIYLIHVVLNVMPTQGVITSLIDYLLPAIPLLFVVINKQIYYDSKEYAKIKIDELPEADFTNFNPIRRMISNPLVRLSKHSNENQIAIRILSDDKSNTLDDIEYDILDDEKTASVFFNRINPVFRYSSFFAVIFISAIFGLGTILEPDKINWYLLLISMYSLIILIFNNFIGVRGKYIFYQKIDLKKAQIEINKTLNKIMPYKIYKETIIKNSKDTYLFVSFCSDVRKYALLLILIFTPILIYFAIGFWHSITGSYEKLFVLLPPLLALLSTYFDEEELISNTDQHNVVVRQYPLNTPAAAIKSEIYSIYRTDRIKNIDIVEQHKIVYAFVFFSLTRSMQLKLCRVCRRH